MYRLEDLNPVQQEAVIHKESPLLILAGAGSGKTRVLTYRIAHLIAQGIEPREILAITFTNKAAQEMRERVGVLVGSEGRGLWVSTFHSACVRILRQEIGNLPGYTRDFIIYDSSDQQTVIKTCLKECNLDEKKFSVRAVGAVISDAKNKLLDCDSFEQQAGDYFQHQVAKVYRAYQKRLKSSNALDFDDLIMLTVLIFRQNPEVLSCYQERFRYILIDEYQDTNYAQYSLVKLLASRYRNLCVVGDDDQSVYGWRGADVKNILDFERDYPEAKVLKLEQNYRSTQTILEAANCVVSNNEKRKEKLLWTENPKGQPLVFYVADDEHDESRYVAERIQFLHNSGGRPYNDFAVLYRTNAQSRVLEERLMKEGIPYRIFSGYKFYERMEIKDVLAYLRVLSNPADKVNFTRILNVPKRGLGGTSLAKVMEYAEEQNMPVLEAVLEADYIPELQPKARKSVLAFAKLMQGLKEFADNETSVTKIVEEILDRTGYQNLLSAEDSPESQARLENLAEFLSVTAEYDLKALGMEYEDEFGVEYIPGLSGFLGHVSLVADTDKIDQQEAAVVLMTMHSVKGLEFPVVFIVGLEEGIFPGARSQLEPELIEEERRLCYVALTRAREKVYLCYAGQRMLYGRRQYNLRSRFLEEIPYNLLEEKDPSDPPSRQLRKPKPQELGSRVSAPGIHSSAFGSPARKLGTPLVENTQEEFLVGDKILHDKFGQGIIMGVTGKGYQTVLTINFEGQLKQIATEYVKLTKL